MKRLFFGVRLCALLVLCWAVGCVNDAVDIERSAPAEVFSDRRVIELVTAAEGGDVQTIEKLAKAGVDVNARGKLGVTPLMRALFKQNKEGFRALLQHGADPNLLTKDGQSVLHQAAIEPDPFFMREALEHKGNADLPNTGNPFSPNSTPLFYAAECHAAAKGDGHRGSHPENVRLLVAAGADVNHRDAKGITPLYAAAESRQYEVMLVLLEGGAEFSSVRPFGQSLQERLEARPELIDPGEGDPENWREYYVKVCEFLNAHGMQIRITEPKPAKQ